MGNLLDHKMIPGEPRWGTNRYNKALEELVTLLAGKAPVNHSHGAGGEVVAIGTSTDRPKVTDGFLFSETDTEQLRILNADGSVRTTLARADEVYTKTETDAAIADYAYSKSETESRLASVLEGLITSKITWESSTTLRIEDGLFHVNNLTRDDIFVLESPITGWNLGSLPASSWVYVYLDPPSSGTTLSVSNFSISTTAPSYTQRKAWYDAANKRCVGVFYVNSGGAIPRFDIVHGWWVWRSNNALILNTSSPSSSVVGVATNTPALGRKLLNLVVRTDANNAADYRLYFYTDSYVADATLVQRATNTGSPWVTPTLWYTGGDGKLYYKVVWGGGGTLDIRWTGMQLPVGLRRSI